MKTFNLTFSQTKYLLENMDRYDVADFISKVNDQPDFIESMGVIEDVAELIAIYEGGCASGAYMPAVTYFTAKKTFIEYEDKLCDYVDGYGLSLDLDKGDCFSNFCAKVCSAAVESWVSSFSDVIELFKQTDY